MGSNISHFLKAHSTSCGRERAVHKLEKEYVQSGLLLGLVGTPVLSICSFFIKWASPMFCLRLDVTLHPLTCQDYVRITTLVTTE